MTKDEMTTLLRSVSCDENTITAMCNAYELGFDHGAQVSQAMRDAIEYGVSMCEYLDFGNLPEAQDMSENFRRAVKAMQ